MKTDIFFHQALNSKIPLSIHLKMEKQQAKKQKVKVEVILPVLSLNQNGRRGSKSARDKTGSEVIETAKQSPEQINNA